jgi:hypothetical protein
MLTYETISDALLDSAEQAGLNVWQSDENIDPQTLNRSFAFKWDAAMTAISTMGTEAMCEKYHGDNVACSHNLMGCAYEATLTLEIGYTIPLNLNLDDDMGSIQRLARTIQDVHRSIVDHKNIVAMDANLHIEGTQVRLTHLKAQQRWTIGDPIHELDSLEDVLEEACSEVRDMLLAIHDRLSGTLETDMDELSPLNLPLDDNDDDRIYLRPPTA